MFRPAAMTTRWESFCSVRHGCSIEFHKEIPTSAVLLQ